MAKELVSICDIGREPDAETWQIKTPSGESSAIELCEKHSKPLRDLLEHARPTGEARQLRGISARSMNARIRGVPEVPLDGAETHAEGLKP